MNSSHIYIINSSDTSSSDSSDTSSSDSSDTNSSYSSDTSSSYSSNTSSSDMNNQPNPGGYYDQYYTAFFLGENWLRLSSITPNLIQKNNALISAIQSFEKAIDINSKRYEAYMSLGEIYYKRNELKEAEKYYTLAWNTIEYCSFEQYEVNEIENKLNAINKEYQLKNDEYQLQNAITHYEMNYEVLSDDCYPLGNDSLDGNDIANEITDYEDTITKLSKEDELISNTEFKFSHSNSETDSSCDSDSVNDLIFYQGLSLFSSECTLKNINTVSTSPVLKTPLKNGSSIK